MLDYFLVFFANGYKDILLVSVFVSRSISSISSDARCARCGSIDCEDFLRFGGYSVNLLPIAIHLGFKILMYQGNSQTVRYINSINQIFHHSQFVSNFLLLTTQKPPFL